MKRKTSIATEKSGLNLVEESVHLALSMPLGGWLAYYTGALPFMLALLFFWAEMAHGAFARERVVESSLVLALLFVWMKCWQSAAMQLLRAHLENREPARWSFARIMRLVLVQGAIQPAGLFVRPIALLITLPYGWVHAFFQSAVILGDGTSSDIKDVVRQSTAVARGRPMQNHIGLAILLLFGFFVWLDIAVAFLFFPQLIRTFTGFDILQHRSVWTMLNTTFFATTIATTYLCVDPLFKAFYILRCFYGASITSGLDLRIGMQQLRKPAVTILACAALFLGLGGPALAAENENTTPEELQTQIDKVLKRPEFAWRMPREPDIENKGPIAQFFDGAAKTVKDWFRPLWRWFDDMIRRFQKWMMERELGRTHQSSSGGGSWAPIAELLLYVLGGIILIGVGILVWRQIKSRTRRSPLVNTTAVESMPDLTSEDIVASQLPEDEWLRLARELIARGEFRLGLRALYLAGLAHLGEKRLVTLARHKSNREYQRELGRRSGSRADLMSAFTGNVATFESVWYGSHPANSEALSKFETNLNQILAC
jgi:hypothetical protein